jgi:hypothetical protein
VFSARERGHLDMWSGSLKNIRRAELWRAGDHAFLPDSFVAIAGGQPHPVFDTIVQALFWPVALCVYLSGPGPDIGPPGKHMHEGTPVQIFAALMGIGLSWTFYSSLIFFILWFRGKRQPKTASKFFG